MRSSKRLHHDLTKDDDRDRDGITAVASEGKSPTKSKGSRIMTNYIPRRNSRAWGLDAKAELHLKPVNGQDLVTMTRNGNGSSSEEQLALITLLGLLLVQPPLHTQVPSDALISFYLYPSFKAFSFCLQPLQHLVRRFVLSLRRIIASPCPLL